MNKDNKPRSETPHTKPLWWRNEIECQPIQLTPLFDGAMLRKSFDEWIHNQSWYRVGRNQRNCHDDIHLRGANSLMKHLLEAIEPEPSYNRVMYGSRVGGHESQPIGYASYVTKDAVDKSAFMWNHDHKRYVVDIDLAKEMMSKSDFVLHHSRINQERQIFGIDNIPFEIWPTDRYIPFPHTKENNNKPVGNAISSIVKTKSCHVRPIQCTQW